MRPLAVLALAFALGVAACGGADERPSASWSGPTFPYPADGALPVDGFRAYQDAVDEEWERDPVALAHEFTQAHDAEVSVDGTRVTVLRDGLEDDSVRAERFTLELARDGDVVLIAGKGAEQGQEFATETIPFDDREAAKEALA